MLLQSGKPVVLDVTVICTSADSYIEASAREADAAAEIAGTCKEAKHSNLPAQYTFLIAIETRGPYNDSTYDLSSLYANSACASRVLTTNVNASSYSNVFHLLCRGLIQFSYMAVYLLTSLINSIQLCFVFLDFFSNK